MENTHISKSNSISRSISTRHVNGVRFAYLQQMGPMTRLKMTLKLQKIPKYETIDKTPVNQASDLAQNTS